MLPEEDRSYHKKISYDNCVDFLFRSAFVSVDYREMLARTESRCFTAEIRSDESHLAPGFVS